MKSEVSLKGARSPDRVAMAAVVFVYLSLEPAYAYVDPGTGAMVLQLAAAALAGVAFYFRAFRSWLWSLFRKEQGDTTATGDRSAGASIDK